MKGPFGHQREPGTEEIPLGHRQTSIMSRWVPQHSPTFIRLPPTFFNTDYYYSHALGDWFLFILRRLIPLRAQIEVEAYQPSGEEEQMKSRLNSPQVEEPTLVSICIFYSSLLP